MAHKPDRIWELDALRGLAILLMVAFHFIFNLEVFFGFDQFDHTQGFWFWEGRIAAVTFIMLVGAASSLIEKRYGKNAGHKNAMRGLRLILLGLVVTVASYLFDSSNTIWFGILSFLGVSILISIPLARYTRLNVLLAVILWASYYQVQNIYTESYTGIIFGIYPPSFQSFDHYALIPWLGFVLLGIALANWIYPEGKAVFKKKPRGIGKALVWTGKYSLWIYLIHQPILLAALHIFLAR